VLGQKIPALVTLKVSTTHKAVHSSYVNHPFNNCYRHFVEEGSIDQDFLISSLSILGKGSTAGKLRSRTFCLTGSQQNYVLSSDNEI